MGSMDKDDDQNNIQEQLEADDRPILTDVEGDKKEFKNKREYSLWKKLRNLVRFDIIDISLKVFFIVLSVPWFISTIFFSIFDTKCIIFDQASVVNCSQDFLISNPRHWVLAWFSMSLTSSVLLLLIIYLNYKKVNFQVEKAKKIYKKGYFVSFVLLLLVSMAFYSIRLYNARSEKTSFSVSILILLSPPVTILLICCLNYLPRIAWTKSDHPFCTIAWWKDCIHKNSNFFIYWLALVLCFVENACKVAGLMLDLAEDVAPLIENKFPDKTGQFRSVMLIVLGFRVTFHARVLTFFWQKIFHGEKDLFSEPSQRLVEEAFALEQQQMEKVDEDKLQGIVLI
ncbi:uncharacterized protein LOC114517067 [Dendronephthya gigantea]|uniref:uncharacterized protein LOC114517067 n=1 Tax=Dendronephthya gigantea TaxID=151771 RepID=UPI00106B7031|nr:uncharacterized protein LOC114517067 [Dendronephthya gigantea]